MYRQLYPCLDKEGHRRGIRDISPTGTDSSMEQLPAEKGQPSHRTTDNQKTQKNPHDPPRIFPVLLLLLLLLLFNVYGTLFIELVFIFMFYNKKFKMYILIS